MKLYSIFLTFLFIISLIFISSLASAATDSDRTLGDEDSAVTMEVFTDFQGPFDAKWWNNTLPLIEEKYVSTDKINIVFKYFPLSSHSNAFDRARAAECAAEQGDFFKFADEFYERLSFNYDYEDFVELAKENDMNIPVFEICFYSSNTENRISKDSNEAMERGFNGVPTFYVGGQEIAGSQPYSTFEEAIEEALRKVEGGSDPRIVTCKDSDNGKDYELSGKTSYSFEGQRKTHEDFCIDNKPLIEGYCEDRKFSNISYECEHGCLNGYCLPKPVKGFRHAYWTCYDGDNQTSEDNSSCKTYETWKSYAREYCEDNCLDGKCGVNSFSISKECNAGFNDEDKENGKDKEDNDDSGFNDEDKENGKDKEDNDDSDFNEIDNNETDDKEIPLVCENSCPLDDKCYPFGYRKVKKFCSDEGLFVSQFESEVTCENNFECSSNVCISNNCVSQSLIDKIFNWFRNLFG